MTEPRRVPPSKTQGSYKWDDITELLREQPETWHLVAEQAPRTLYQAVMRQRMIAMRDPDWRYVAVTRNTHENKADLWMMARPRTEEEKLTWDSRL